MTDASTLAPPPSALPITPAAGERSPAYERAQAACDEALAVAGPELVERDFTFAGRQVRMRVAGRELAEHLMRPFAHLRTAHSRTPAPAALTIDAWDERAVHVPYPPGDDREPNETRRRAMACSRSRRRRATCATTARRG